jgi:uncharacterized protein (DUF924 family)
MIDDDARALLAFWFAEGDTWRQIWFRATPEFDATLRERFGPLRERAAAGALDHWGETAEGALVLLLLLDQLPRNIHRGHGAAFATDAKARETARRAIARGIDREFPPVRRQFFYLPFEHSEFLSDQKEGIRLFATMPEGEFRDRCCDHARRHHAVIARFGRFPHRNAALGRVSTALEEEFLAGPGAPY